MDVNEKFVITLNRELGSGGRTVGRRLCERLHVKYYDKAVVEGLVQHFGLTVEDIERRKGRRQNWWTEFCDAVVAVPTLDYTDDNRPVQAKDLYQVETRILQEIAEAESCVIAGRSGHFILRDHPNKLSLFIRASLEHRIQRVMAAQGLTEEEARALIAKVDTGRDNFTQHFTGTSRYDLRNYDLVLNMDGLTEDEAVDLIIDYIGKNN